MWLFRLSSCVWLAALLALTIVHAQDFDSETPTPQPKPDLTNVRIVQKLGHLLPAEAQFSDRDGSPVRLANFLNARPLIVLPIFYRCTGVCNLELQSLVATLPKTRRSIGRDFDVLVLSIDPNEGPGLAKAKCASTIATQPAFAGTENGWHFLTGNLENIRKLTDSLGFYFKFDPIKDQINHPSGIMFVTPSGVVSSYILGANYSPKAIASDIDLASKSRVGEKTADVFFGCVHIDPLTGKRSIVIEGVLRIAGFATILAIAGILGFGRFRSRKQPLP